ncbi:MAG: hypothetical protein R3C05_08375, partial [Pirellulaceae bacterium]
QPRTAPSNMNSMESENLPRRFAFDGPMGDVIEQHLNDDIRSARLSRKFKIYYRLRPWLPIFLRQRLQRKRNRGMEVDADWYLPKDFIHDWRQAVSDVLAQQSAETLVIHPWPEPYQFASVLTHDVETWEGVKLVPALAELEEKLGFRSAWNFIPYKYNIDAGMLDDLAARGHEIGIHGYNHDGRLFESRGTFNRRSGPINDALDRYRSIGFRAPMVHRNLTWLQQLNIQYDASCFDVDPFQAMPGGVGSPWPMIVGRFVELPYTLPQDHTLLIALGETTPRIWIDKLAYLRRMSAMAMLITHPDYLDTQTRLNVYHAFLEHLSEQSDCWFALPKDVADWWRQRDASRIDSATNQITGPASSQGRPIALRELFVQSDSHDHRTHS